MNAVIIHYLFFFACGFLNVVLFLGMTVRQKRLFVCINLQYLVHVGLFVIYTGLT